MTSFEQVYDSEKDTVYPLLRSHRLKERQDQESEEEILEYQQTIEQDRPED